jgi:mono/diheme cytochrome c family protein
MKKRRALASLFAFTVFAAFGGVSAQPVTPVALNSMQALGQKTYFQHCGVCHTKPTILSPYYGPALSRDIVNHNEDALREFIRTGSDRMPGFQYSLDPKQIDAVIQYLKTVTPPADANAPAKPAPRGNEREVD